MSSDDTVILCLIGAAVLLVAGGAFAAARIRRLPRHIVRRFVIKESATVLLWSALVLTLLLMVVGVGGLVATLVAFMLLTWTGILVGTAAVDRVRVGKLERSLAQLGVPERRVSAAEDILLCLSPVPEKETAPSVYASNVLNAGVAMIRVALWEPAENVLSRLRPEWLLPDEQVVWGGWLMGCRMMLGNARGAELIADLVPFAGPRDAAGWLSAQLRAWCLACRGRHAEAVKILAGVPEEEVREYGLLARAHALAGAGDEQGAREILARVEKLGAGSQALRPAGPATPLAQQMAKQGGPYR